MPRSDVTLAIETSNPSSSHDGWTAVAVGRPNPEGPAPCDVLARASLEPTSRHDDALLPAIDRACRGAGIGPSDLGRIAVSIGPGGFTALRIAATAAKMLALTQGVECVAVPTARALARRTDPVADGKEIVVALGWKRESVWVERFRSPAAPISAGLEPLERLALTRCDVLVADDRFVAMLREQRGLSDEIRTEPPRFDAVAVLEASAGLAPTDPVAFGPLYPREPEAVTKWRELHGS